ncbi:SgrR family transcriptional regulator [Paenibacillus sp. MWE-103]|uniref:SgrR family transcriptional regulator n=1 Tax=Paenibacillus artemisiicola TaxID=1172618 RepID=A0ABS3WAV0_9BACL|nr:ABC transporter substrate-binding protein [Paenibacillus artemisiicola]MBO7745431.1 SgrR family transcriptional regulator [Paenibacillus artemisiicola]
MQAVQAERYLTLMQRFAEEAGAGTPVEVTLDELAQALYCTARNAKLVLRRMEEDGWIVWQPGRGRGNRSRIEFRMEREALALDIAKALAGQGSYKQAFALLHRFGGGTPVKERFNEWLTLHFGYRSETGEDARRVDMLRLPIHVPLVTMDPAEVYFAFDAHIIRQLFDRLVAYDAKAGQVVPSLAHAWECSADATAWQFHLRRGVIFHTGHELMADDVVYTLERLRKGRSNSWLLRGVAAVEAAGPRTVKVTLAKPNRIFHRFMCSTAASILPREPLQRDEEAYWRRPSGTGPFMIQAWDEERLVLDAHPGYFNGRAHLDGVVIAIVPSGEGIDSEHCWEQLVLAHDARDQQRDQSWAKLESLLQGCSLMTWNRNKPGPQQSQSFRRAVDLLLDRSLMLRELGENRMYAARSFRPDAHSALRHVRSDAGQAETLLREAGYDGTPFTLYTRRWHERDAKWIQARCAAFGVRMDIRLMEGDECRDLNVLGEADAILYSLVFAEDEVCEIETYEQTGSFLNAHMDPALLAWAKGRIDLAVASETPEQRRFLLEEMEDRLREETQVTFLLHKRSNTTYKPELKGIALSPLGWIDFKDVWVRYGGGTAEQGQASERAEAVR